ncbi:hypothetical protein M758_5G128500 [Ceratodon purpureus]|nr:hypothetical protein M758_5G128500 [Ceratodon purpureus]
MLVMAAFKPVLRINCVQLCKSGTRIEPGHQEREVVRGCKLMLELLLSQQDKGFFPAFACKDFLLVLHLLFVSTTLSWSKL